MRVPRSVLFSNDEMHLHLINHSCDASVFFSSHDKSVFQRLMQRMALSFGIDILAHCVMSNHFHILVRVPERHQLVDDHTLLQHLKHYYSEEKLAELQHKWNCWNKNGLAEHTQADILRLKQRLFDPSIFMQQLQFQFTRYYNRTHQREGNLWRTRYRSVLLEGQHKTLSKVAAYIDLNPVRAKITDDPKDYLWCSYAAALGNDPIAKAGLAYLVHNSLREEDRSKPLPAQDIASIYRTWLFGKKAQKKIKPELIRQALQNNGKLGLEQLLRCRARYMNAGLVLGSKDFIDTFLEEKRGWFGNKRKIAGHKLKGGDWEELHSFRNLQKDNLSI